MGLPYPGKVFTPLDVLPASDLTETTANIEYLETKPTTPAQWTNPYAFRVFLTTPHNTSAGSFIPILFDTKTYDVSTNVDVATNKGRFTAPVKGLYSFKGNTVAVLGGISVLGIALYKNGSVHSLGDQVSNNNSYNGYGTSVNITDDIQLDAGQYVELNVICNGVATLVAGSDKTYFSGHLVTEL